MLREVGGRHSGHQSRQDANWYGREVAVAAGLKFDLPLLCPIDSEMEQSRIPGVWWCCKGHGDTGGLDSQGVSISLDNNRSFYHPWEGLTVP